MTEELVHQLGYLGITLILILGGLGLPIPEEAPIILAAVLSQHGQMWWPYAVAACMTGVLIGDFVVYFLGYFYGDKVLSFPVTRRLLTRAREAQIKGYFHRHGFKILVLSRFAPGFRTAAYLTAGILQLPPIKLLLTDLIAASLSTSIVFGLGFFFANQIQGGLHQFQRWMVIIICLILISWLLHRFIRARQRSGQPVGPPVQLEDELFPPYVADAVKASKILDDPTDPEATDPIPRASAELVPETAIASVAPVVAVEPDVEPTPSTAADRPAPEGTGGIFAGSSDFESIRPG